MNTSNRIFRNRKFAPDNLKLHVRFLHLVLLLSMPAMVFAQTLTDPALNFTLFIKEDLVLKSTEVEGRVAVGGNLVMAGGTYQISPRQKDNASAFRVGGLPIGLAVRGGVSFSGSGDLKVNEKNYVKIGNPNFPNALSVNYQDPNGFRVKYANNQGGTITINTNPAAFSTPPVSASNNPVFENVFGQGEGKIDIDAAFANFELTSQALNNLAHNVPVRTFGQQDMAPIAGPFVDSELTLPSSPEFILDPYKINVLTISKEVWNRFQNGMRFKDFWTNPDPKFALIINIVGTGDDVSFREMPDLKNSKRGHVVFNFPDATSEIKLTGHAQIDGVILAPKAKVIKRNGANMVGQVIARSFEHDGHEIHYEPLKPEWIDEAIDVSVATFCLQDAPYLDYEVTGNFDMTGLKATIEWLTPEGDLVQKLTNQPLAGRILFPGAAVDENGYGIAWPGWRFVSGRWEQFDDLNSKLRLPGAKIRVTVNPIFLAAISYPPGTDDCFTNPPPTHTPPLPVRLVSFSVTGEELHTAALKWRVADAKDFSHFEVERSPDGRSFSPAAVVDFTTERNDYRFVDRKPYSDISYYRLKLVDLDGSFAYSKVESVKTGFVSEGALLYGYPNPFTEIITIVSGSRQAAAVYDVTGRVVEKLRLEEGINEINGRAWPAGLNLIRTEDGRTVKAIRN